MNGIYDREDLPRVVEPEREPSLPPAEWPKTRPQVDREELERWFGDRSNVREKSTFRNKKMAGAVAVLNGPGGRARKQVEKPGGLPSCSDLSGGRKTGRE